MNRRAALKAISLVLGGSAIGSTRFLNAQFNSDSEAFGSRFTAKDLAILDEIGETILPATEESQGAKAAKIGAFMKEIVSTTYSDADRGVFLAGIGKLDQFSKERATRPFLDLYPEERYGLLLELESNDTPRYYRMMKELTLWGYFSSEVGATQALAHLPVPGRWDPCIKVAPDTKPWS